MTSAPLHIGLIGPLPPPFGGMAAQTLKLRELLQKEGVRVDLLQTNADYKPRFVAKVRGVRALFRLIPYLIDAWKLAGQVQVIHLMANSGWSWQLFASPILWIGWLRKVPVIVNYRGGGAQSFLAKSIRTVRPTIRLAKKVVVPSGYLEKIFADFDISAQVIPNIIDLDQFTPNPGEELRPFTLVMTRNLEPIYGIDTAIKAVAKLRGTIPDIRLLIAGSGPQLGDLKALVATLGLNKHVDFLGRLDRAGVIALYQKADVMLNTTTVDNMPNSVLEALACGIPVVTSRVGGVPYIVEDENTALFVPVGDAQTVARQVERLWNDSTLRSRLSEQGKEHVKQYTWLKIGHEWLDLYRILRMAT